MRWSDTDGEMQVFKETAFGKGLNVGVRAWVGDRQILFSWLLFSLPISYIPPLLYLNPLKVD